MFGWFKRHEGERARAHRADGPTCLHTALVPRFESVADMGHEDRATGFRCESCGSTFTPAEAHTLRSTEAQRVHSEVERTVS